VAIATFHDLEGQSVFITGQGLVVDGGVVHSA
jgi:hypothetical protein